MGAKCYLPLKSVCANPNHQSDLSQKSSVYWSSQKPCVRFHTPLQYPFSKPCEFLQQMIFRLLWRCLRCLDYLKWIELFFYRHQKKIEEGEVEVAWKSMPIAQNVTNISTIQDICYFIIRKCIMKFHLKWEIDNNFPVTLVEAFFSAEWGSTITSGKMFFSIPNIAWHS